MRSSATRIRLALAVSFLLLLLLSLHSKKKKVLHLETRLTRGSHPKDDVKRVQARTQAYIVESCWSSSP